MYGRAQMSRNLRVIVSSGGKEKEEVMAEGSTVEDLLRSFRMHPDAYIVTKDSKPVPITRMLEDGEKLKIIKVASGG